MYAITMILPNDKTILSNKLFNTEDEAMEQAIKLQNLAQQNNFNIIYSVRSTQT